MNEKLEKANFEHNLKCMRIYFQSLELCINTFKSDINAIIDSAVTEFELKCTISGEFLVYDINHKCNMNIDLNNTKLKKYNTLMNDNIMKHNDEQFKHNQLLSFTKCIGLQSMILMNKNPKLFYGKSLPPHTIERLIESNKNGKKFVKDKHNKRTPIIRKKDGEYFTKKFKISDTRH